MSTIQKRLSTHLEKANSVIASRRKFITDLSASVVAAKGILEGYFLNPVAGKVSEALDAIADVRNREELLLNIAHFHPERDLWRLINSPEIKLALVDLLQEKQQLVRVLWAAYRRDKSEAALVESPDRIIEEDQKLSERFDTLQGFDQLLKTVAPGIADFPPTKNQPGEKDFDYIVSLLQSIS